MPKLSYEEVARRKQMLDQELRIIHGGQPLKRQLEHEVTELRKCMFIPDAPQEKYLHRIISQLQDQLSIISNTAWQEQLEQWSETVKFFQRSGASKSLPHKKNSPLFDRAKSLINQKKCGSISHMQLPLMPHLVKDEEEYFQELVFLLSEMAHDYNPTVFMETLIDSYAVYVDRYGNADEFADKLIAKCMHNRMLLSDIGEVFSDDSILNLIEQMDDAFDTEEDEFYDD